MTDELTEDVKPNWLNPIRQAQSACKDNEGIAIVTLRVAVVGSSPILWLGADVDKVHPKGLMDNADAVLPLVALLQSMAGKDGT